MKQRFSSLDIKVIAHELSNTLTSLRVSNIYDLSSRIFLFKFAKPDRREQFVIDSGFRCHLTSFARTTAGVPSGFVARLRKFLRTRRVTKVSQIGTDRVLEFQFSDGQYRLFLEFYASGNIVLTDRDLNVIALLRNVTEGAEHEQLRLGSIYNLSERQNINGIPPLDAARIKEGLQKFVDRQAENEKGVVKNKKWKVKPGDMLRRALGGSITEYPPMLLDHALRASNFDTTVTPQEVLQDENLIQQLLSSLEEASRVTTEITQRTITKGYIIAKSKDTQSLLYDDFHPFKPKHFEDEPSVKFIEIEGYNRTVDEFFSSIEGQKLESRLQEKEDAAKKKLEQAKANQENKLKGLQDVQELNIRKAQAVEANLERVGEAINAIVSLIAQGMDWIEIDRLIELEQKRKNPVAEIIKIPLKLEENTATLLLEEWDHEDENEEDQGYETDSDPSDSEDGIEQKSDLKTKTADTRERPVDKRLAIDIDLALSPWANAREYYDQKRSAAAKQEKTALSQEKALKSATQKIESDLKRALGQEKQVLRPVRNQLWFEKFLYFISSDGYLVLGGKDAQQSEILYKRYLKHGDVFVHADLKGALTLIIKNWPNTPDAPIPPTTLAQAGNMVIATSIAWDSKIVTSAWWADAKQVTKTASTGDYLPIGIFEIRGQKHFLPPAQLLLGFAVLFRISDSSKARHLKHRVPVQAPESTTDGLSMHHSDDEEVNHLDSESDNAPHEFQKDESEDGSGTEQDDDDAHSEAAYNNPLQARRTQAVHDHGEQSGNATSIVDSESRIGHEEHTNLASSDTGSDNEDENEASDDNLDNPEESSAPQSVHSETKVTTNEKPKVQVQVRGKRGKKKIQKRYADQDDEDRELAMQLLGSTKGQQKAEAAAKSAQERQAKLEADKIRRREQHQRIQQEGKAREEARLQKNHHEETQETDEDVTVITDLDALVGTPLPGDEILEAIPVCAPWSALVKYKYKAKLQPGSVKKGKAVKEILGRWSVDGADRKKVDQESQDTEKIWPKEIELIKYWKDTEVFNVMPVGKVRVMMAGSANVGAKGGQAKGKGRSGKGPKKVR